MRSASSRFSKFGFGGNDAFVPRFDRDRLSRERTTRSKTVFFKTAPWEKLGGLGPDASLTSSFMPKEKIHYPTWLEASMSFDGVCNFGYYSMTLPLCRLIGSM